MLLFFSKYGSVMKNSGCEWRLKKLNDTVSDQSVLLMLSSDPNILETHGISLSLLHSSVLDKFRRHGKQKPQHMTWLDCFHSIITNHPVPAYVSHSPPVLQCLWPSSNPSIPASLINFNINPCSFETFLWFMRRMSSFSRKLLWITSASRTLSGFAKWREKWKERNESIFHNVIYMLYITMT